MATVKNPALFSKHFHVKPKELERLGIFDPILNADTKLFIDPLLLKQSSQATIKRDASAAFEDHFGKIIKLLVASREVGDAAWRNAMRMFIFKEPRETCLGYGDRTIHGSAIGPTLGTSLLRTAKQIVDTGVRDPELFALLKLLEEGIGPDRISDMTTHVIRPALIKFNEAILPKLGVKTEDISIDRTLHSLARNPFEADKKIAVLLLPKDILRELPVVNDWSDVADAADKNRELRDRVSEQIGNIWEIKTRKDKEKARDAVLRSRDGYEALKEAISRIQKVPYDAAADPEGHYLWRSVLAEIAALFPVKIVAAKQKNLKELERIVDEIIAAFSDLVENKGQWYHLWQNGKPRRERAAQRLFFAIAEAYCKANDIDVSPETDSGGGPVDFKFSNGSICVVVELKLSTGRVVHGYQTQIEVYKAAAGTARGKFLVVDVGSMGQKVKTIFDMRNARAKKGEPVTDIIVVDGRKKKPASIR